MICQPSGGKTSILATAAACGSPILSEFSTTTCTSTPGGRCGSSRREPARCGSGTTHGRSAQGARRPHRSR
eukprot:14934547-Alexandrium_andersonii.AAC.1